MINYIFLYGLAGASEAYRVIRYSKISNYRNMPISQIKAYAKQMVEDYPLVKQVYAIDNSYMLYEAYRETALHFSIENNVAFKSLLENEGIRII